MSEYRLVVSFGDYFPTMAEEGAFALGVEWQMVAAALDRGDMGPHTVHTTNVPLLSRLAKSRDLLMEIAECEPVTEGWQVARFGGAGSGGQDKHHDRDREQADAAHAY